MPEFKTELTPIQQENKRLLGTFFSELQAISKNVEEINYSTTPEAIDTIFSLIYSADGTNDILLERKIFTREKWAGFHGFLLDTSKRAGKIKERGIFGRATAFYNENLIQPFIKKRDAVFLALANDALEQYRLLSDSVDIFDVNLGKYKSLKPPVIPSDNWTKFQADLKDFESSTNTLRNYRGMIGATVKSTTGLDMEGLSKTKITGLGEAITLSLGAIITISVLVLGLGLIVVLGYAWSKEKDLEKHTTERQALEVRSDNEIAITTKPYDESIDGYNKRIKEIEDALKARGQPLQGLGQSSVEDLKAEREQLIKKRDEAIANREKAIVNARTREEESKSKLPYPPPEMSWSNMVLWGVGIASGGYVLARIVPAWFNRPKKKEPTQSA